MHVCMHLCVSDRPPQYWYTLTSTIRPKEAFTRPKIDRLSCIIIGPDFVSAEFMTAPDTKTRIRIPPPKKADAPKMTDLQ